jgi:hypothetical protein
MDHMCHDTSGIVSQILVNLECYTLLMVNHYFRDLTKHALVGFMKAVKHLCSERLQRISLRCASCLPILKLKRMERRGDIVVYSTASVRSNTLFVMGEWTFLGKTKIIPLKRKRVHSLMMNYTRLGAIWDLKLLDNIRRPPDVLIFVQDLRTLYSRT